MNATAMWYARSALLFQTYAQESATGTTIGTVVVVNDAQCYVREDVSAVVNVKMRDNNRYNITVIYEFFKMGIKNSFS